MIPPPKIEESTLTSLPPNPCVPTPCGPNSVCQVVSNQAQCGCQANMIGTAPNCRPECLVGSDCSSSLSCINNRCIDPCPGTCAPNAECRVINHSPTCNCLTGYSGNGFDMCRPIPAIGMSSIFYSLSCCIWNWFAPLFFLVPMIGRNVAGSILKLPRKCLPLVIVD